MAAVSVPGPAPGAIAAAGREPGHGEIERLVILDRLPVLAGVTRKKVKLTQATARAPSLG